MLKEQSYPLFWKAQWSYSETFGIVVPTTDQSIEDPKDLVETNCQYHTFEKTWTQGYDEVEP